MTSGGGRVVGVVGGVTGAGVAGEGPTPPLLVTVPPPPRGCGLLPGGSFKGTSLPPDAADTGFAEIFGGGGYVFAGLKPFVVWQSAHFVPNVA